MKIFFVSKKMINRLKSKHILIFSICILAFLLFGFQLISHFKMSSSPAMSQSIAQTSFSVTLTPEGTLPKEGAMIFVNGEEYAPLLLGSNLVELSRPSAIEVFCQTDADFCVTVKASPGTTLIMPETDLQCKKGMNYICRCFFSD